jgi:hypothetical protein
MNTGHLDGKKRIGEYKYDQRHRIDVFGWKAEAEDDLSLTPTACVAKI